MKTKNCPFCSKEISDEAIICKFCHRLLIDENGNDILPEDEYEEDTETVSEDPGEPVFDEEKTIVYNKEDLQNLLNKNRASDEHEDNNETEELNTDAVITQEDEDDLPDDDTDDGDFGDDEGYEPEPQPVFRRSGSSENEYEDEELANAADYDPKRTFMITAIVTLGILLIIIVAVLVGYKLFGFGDKEGGTTTSQTQLTAAASQADPTASAAADTASLANPDDSAFVPQLTDDTVSENPEEIVNSSLSDPAVNTSSVTDPNTAVPGVTDTPVVDSAASTPETVISPDSASDSSQANIVIIPDPTVTSSADDTTADSTASADSVGDGPAADSSADSSSKAAAGPGAPAFDAAGSYYSWSEADSLMANYASANGIENYAYAYGTDEVEMIYEAYGDDGSVSYYRVDLQTGYVSAY